MKFSEKWLREWVNPSLSTKALCDKLTMAGLEVDSIQDALEAFQNDKDLGTLSDIPKGVDLSEYLQLDDTLIEMDLTPNRGDCLSIQGIAREISVLTDAPLTILPKPEIPPIQDDLIIPIQIDAPSACPRYIGRIIQGIQTTTTPIWLRERLRRSDIRCIHPVVDILNYVMIELGQPMHAFDAEKVKAPLTVRYALDGEKIALLNGQIVSLKAQTLVIGDAAKAPLALAGIMGGQESGVTENTKTIIVESALFTSHLIAGKARTYGLHTDSSARFERGVDSELQLTAMERATALICEICGGVPGPIIERVSTQDLPKREWIVLRTARLKALLGYEIAHSRVMEILQKLGCVVEPLDTANTETTWRVLPPSFRGDILVEVDLIEEIVRIFGYDNIPATMPISHLQFVPQSTKKMSLDRIKRALVDMGYQEVITYSFVDDNLQKQLFSEEALAIINPISADMNVMRLSLWPGLLTTLKYNQNRQQHRMKIFETGLRFQKKDTLIQENVIGGLVAGDFSNEHWNMPKRLVDFFDVKNTLTSLWSLSGQNESLVFEAAQHLACHPGQCADIRWRDQLVGVLGRLHPKIEKMLDLQGPIYLFELSLAIFNEIPLPIFERPSRFPEIRRDIAIIVDEKISSGSLINYVRKSAGELLRDVQIFDVYTGKGIDSGQKSIALGLILQHPSRTLVDKEVDDVVHTIVVGLEKEFTAKLRE